MPEVVPDVAFVVALLHFGFDSLLEVGVVGDWF